MQREYNSEAFLPEEVKAGRHIRLIETLIDLDGYDPDDRVDRGCLDRFHDIHITSDGYCLIVEWCDHYFDEGVGEGSFQFVGSDQRVADEITLPDNSIELAWDAEDAKRIIDNWTAKHPEYQQD